MRKALRRLLTTHGFSVEEFERGDDFLAVVTADSVDCLVLDLHMPEVTGMDVLSALQLRNLHTPIVVITGHDGPGMRERTLELGASAYLTKPVDEAALISAIRSALDPKRTTTR